MKDNLTIKALKFISQRYGEYKPVEMKEFLLNNFEEKPEMAERIEMKRFMEYLKKSDLIEYISNDGIWLIQIAGRKVPRNEISAIVKITSKGFALIRENDKYNKTTFSFYLSVFLGLTSVLFGVLNYWNKEELMKAEIGLKLTNDSLAKVREDYYVLGKENLNLKTQVKEKTKPNIFNQKFTQQ